MKFATVEKDGNKCAVITEDKNHVILINDVLETKYMDMSSFISGHTPIQMEKLRKASKMNQGIDIGSVKLKAPIMKPVHDIVCVGINYSAHLEEHKNHFMSGDFVAPAKTVYFGKRAICITGPDEPIFGHLDMDGRLDYEVELAVIIGSTINSSTTYDNIGKHIFGYSVFNDISARSLQKEHDQWYYGKSLDSFSVMGPWIVTSDEISINEDLDMECRINGEVRQHSNTCYMIRNISDLIFELSRGITLEAGDIIATGTPSGVGQGFTPPRFLKKGDVVEAEIEKIGILRNTIV